MCKQETEALTARCRFEMSWDQLEGGRVVFCVKYQKQTEANESCVGAPLGILAAGCPAEGSGTYSTYCMTLLSPGRISGGHARAQCGSPLEAVLRRVTINCRDPSFAQSWVSFFLFHVPTVWYAIQLGSSLVMSGTGLNGSYSATAMRVQSTFSGNTVNSAP